MRAFCFRADCAKDWLLIVSSAARRVSRAEEVMTYKNSIRILSSNFSLCWKQLVWTLLSALVVGGISIAVITPVFNMLKAEGFCAELTNCFEAIYTTPKTVPMKLVDLVNMFCSLISSHASSLWGSYVGFAVVLLVLGNLFRCVGLFACSSVLGSRMASNAQIGYTNRLLSTLGRSVSYSFVHLLCSLPFYLVFGLVIYGYVSAAKNTLLAVALLPVFSLVLYVIFALKLSMFSCVLPEMIDGERNPFKAFASGIKLMSTRFWRTLSNSVCVVLTVVLVNGFLGVFTLGAGLLITVPASCVFVSAFGMVTQYAAKNRNFYVSELVVVNLK